VSLPPLRHRTGDILPLARHFVRLFSRKLGGAEAGIEPAAQQALLDYPGPATSASWRT
jgi:sigma-54 dependent transcriptional regulator